MICERLWLPLLTRVCYVFVSHVLCATGAEQGILSAVEQIIGKMKNHETVRINVKSIYGYGEEGNEEHNISKEYTNYAY